MDWPAIDNFMQHQGFASTIAVFLVFFVTISSSRSQRELRDAIKELAKSQQAIAQEQVIHTELLRQILSIRRRNVEGMAK